MSEYKYKPFETALFKKTLKFGKEFKLVLLCRGMRRITSSVGKVYRDKSGSVENIQEEIADVQLMLDQVKLIYDEDEINRIMDQKLVRLKSRFEKTQGVTSSTNVH